MSIEPITTQTGVTLAIAELVKMRPRYAKVKIALRAAIADHYLQMCGRSVTRSAASLGIHRESLQRIRRARVADLPKAQQQLIEQLAEGLIRTVSDRGGLYRNAMKKAEHEICAAALLQHKSRTEAARAIGVHRNLLGYLESKGKR